MELTRRKFLAGTALAMGAFSMPLLKPALAQQSTMRMALAARGAGALTASSTKSPGAANWPLTNIYNTLVASPAGTYATRPEMIQPQLAESWQVDETQQIWTFKLRQGVKWHKGYGEVSADDVVFTFERHIDPEKLTANKSTYAIISSVKATDPLTVEFTLTQPDPLFGLALGAVVAAVMCKAALEEKGEDAHDFDPIGSGPYQFVSGTADSSIILEANADYIDGAPPIQTLQFDFIPDATARTLAFAAGQADVIEGVRSPGWIDQIRARSPNTIFDATKPGSSNFLSFNLNVEPLNNLLVRQAFRYAINNEQIAATFNDLGNPMVGMLAEGVAGAAEKSELPADLQYAPDVEKAKALLVEAGYPNGFSLDCFVSQRDDYSSIMLIIQEQLRAAGIDLNIRMVDHSVYHSESRKDLNSLYLYSVTLAPSPTLPFVELLSSPAEVKTDGSGGLNLSHYGVAMPGIDDLLSTAKAEPDFEARAALVNQMEQKVLTDLPALGIINLSYVAARNPRLDLGYEIVGGTPYWRFDKATLS